jgi:heat shock protein HtpX
MGNTLKTGVLLALLTVLFVGIGNYAGGQSGMIMAFGFAVLMNAGAYWFSDKIVLRMYRAQEVSEAEEPQLHAMVHRLATAASLPMPKVYILPSDSPNAFATGRNPQHAAVAVTQGIMRILTPDELEGVLAHEMAHVKNRDILIGTVAATLAGAIMMVARFAQYAAIFGGGGRDREEGGGGLGLIVMAILAPIGAMLVQMAVSRSRARPRAGEDRRSVEPHSPRCLAGDRPHVHPEPAVRQGDDVAVQHAPARGKEGGEASCDAGGRLMGRSPKGGRGESSTP